MKSNKFFTGFIFFVVMISMYSGCSKDSVVGPPSQSNSHKAGVINPQEGQVIEGTVQIEVRTYNETSFQKFTFYVDGVFAGSDDREPWEFNYNTQNRSNGDVEFKVRGYDSSGLRWESQSIRVTVYNDNKGKGVEPY